MMNGYGTSMVLKQQHGHNVTRKTLITWNELKTSIHCRDPEDIRKCTRTLLTT